MPLITWDDSISVNIAIIDAQHKRMIDIINKMHEAMKKGEGKNVIIDILNELAQYKKMHFATEEKYFKNFNYENTETHMYEHIKFGEKIEEFKTKLEQGESITIELLEFVKNWLTHHIKEVDKKYIKCFNEHGLK